MPTLYIAYDPARAEISDVPHRNLKQLWLSGDKTVSDAIKELAGLTDRGRTAMLAGDWTELSNERAAALSGTGNARDSKGGPPKFRVRASPGPHWGDACPR